MTDKELVERLRENAEWAQGNEWETPICLSDDLADAASRIEQLHTELTKEKIDNTNLIGELATVAAERDRYKAERDAAEHKRTCSSTNADRIRAMDDKAISVLLSAVKFRRECFIKIPDFLSIQDAYKWLQQPAEEKR